MLDKTAVRDIAARYAEEVRKVLEPDAVILFGSYVNGTPHDWSDIDIAIVINNFHGDWLETASMLQSLTRRVSIEIEPHVLDETCDKSGFVGHVIKTGEVIYKAA